MLNRSTVVKIILKVAYNENIGLGLFCIFFLTNNIVMQLIFFIIKHIKLLRISQINDIFYYKNNTMICMLCIKKVLYDLLIILYELNNLVVNQMFPRS